MNAFRLIFVAVAAVAQQVELADQCDNLGWSDWQTHVPGGNGTNQTAYSWHIHYLHTDDSQESEVAAFQSSFCTEFAKYGESGSSISSGKWGPNAIEPNAEYIYGACSKSELNMRSNGQQCGNGTCPAGAQGGGPWSVCQSEFFIPAKYIDEVSEWIIEQAPSIPVMRHPNTGCQWGDHSPDMRATFFSGPVPEMCLWGLPCNDPGFGCEQGMCGDLDGTHDVQHADECVLEVDDAEVLAELA